jgi:hypothetical protein
MCCLRAKMMVGAAVLLAALLAAGNSAHAQKPGDTPTVNISFRNDTNTPVLLQGYTIVKNFQRRGQPLLIREGKSSFDNNVPAGVRFITIVDYNQPNRVLLRDAAIPVAPSRDLQIVIRPAPGNPHRVILLPDQ